MLSIYEYDEEEAKKVFWEDGYIEGLLEAKNEIKIKVRIESIFELLEDIGEIPQPLKKKISTETDFDILTKWLKAAAKADSIDEFEKLIIQ